MVRLVVNEFYTYDADRNPLNFVAGFSNEGDTLPEEGIINGSRILEVDSGDVRVFDETAAAGSKWGVMFNIKDS